VNPQDSARPENALGSLYMTCDNCFVRRRNADVFERIIAAVSEAYDGDVYMIDTTMIRVHQRAANRKKTIGSAYRPLARWPDDEGPYADGCGLPLEPRLTPGKTGNCPEAAKI